MKEFWEWLLDIKTLLAFLMVVILILWYLTRDKDILSLARDFAVAIISLATGYKIGKQAATPPEPPEMPK
jgi:hypothetical protein